MHASVNMGCQGKSGPGKIHEVILVFFVSYLCYLEKIWSIQIAQDPQKMEKQCDKNMLGSRPQ